MCIESLIHELYLKDILITELQVLSGFSLEQLCELFKAGYTLMPPRQG